MKKILLLLSLSISQLLTGCSDSHSESGASKVSASVISPAVGNNGLIDSCSLVNKADIENTIGGQFSTKSDVVLTENKKDLYEKSGDCKILSADSKSRIYFTTFVAKDENTLLATYKLGQQSVNSGQVVEGIQSHEISGLGSSAYTYNFSYGPGFANRSIVLVMLSGKKMVHLSMNDFPDDMSIQIEKAKDLAAKIIKIL